jgi:hypothetical protein
MSDLPDVMTESERAVRAVLLGLVLGIALALASRLGGAGR